MEAPSALAAPPLEQPAAAEASEELKAKIRQQIEYYFSDSNFRHDKFLRGKAAEDGDGWVQLAIIASFNRLKSLTADIAVVAEAMEDSKELELSQDKLAVRRTRGLPEDDDSETRSVYVVRSVHAPHTGRAPA